MALAHLVLLAIVGFWRFPAKAPAAGEVMEFVALPSQQVSTTPPASGSATQAPAPPAAAPPSPTPVTPPPPSTPVTPPTPPTPVAEEQPPAPAPVPSVPSEIVIPQKPTPPAPETPAKTEKAEKKKKKKKEKAPVTPATEAADDPADDTPPAKPTPHVPKVNLQEVDRTAVIPAATKGVTDGKGTKPNESKSAEGEGNGLTASGVKDALSKSLNGSGLDNRVVGPASGGGGAAGTADQWYYNLIRQAMYGAWAQPSEFAGQPLNTKIKIHIAADGTVSDPSIAVSSGNAAYDASALDAARSVKQLSKPRPDAIPESIVVNFQMAN